MDEEDGRKNRSLWIVSNNAELSQFDEDLSVWGNRFSFPISFTVTDLVRYRIYVSDLFGFWNTFLRRADTITRYFQTWWRRSNIIALCNIKIIHLSKPFTKQLRIQVQLYEEFSALSSNYQLQSHRFRLNALKRKGTYVVVEITGVYFLDEYMAPQQYWNDCTETRWWGTTVTWQVYLINKARFFVINCQLIQKHYDIFEMLYLSWFFHAATTERMAWKCSLGIT